MSYDEAIAWWYGRIDYERRAPQPGDLKLEQMRELLRRLDEPQRGLRIVHIAGSKGKGSTAAMLASVLRAAGYRTGLFTSPHLMTVEERIRVDDESIPRDQLARLITEIRDRVGTTLTPTFFEVGTAAGFLHFRRQNVDVAVVEVGLGGRFDSTNVCTPALAVITSISFDHTKILGERLERIAFEKAGIIKPGRPVVSGAVAPEARPIIERVAAQRGSPLIQLERDFFFRHEPGVAGGRRSQTIVRTARETWPAFEVGLLGAHQAANAAVAVACIEELRNLGLTIRDEHIAAGLAGVVWPARLEVLNRAPWVVLDCAHNTASVQALIETLAESFPPGRHLLVYAASTDKDVPGMLRRMAPHFQHFFFTRYGDNPRSVATEQLSRWLREIAEVPSQTFDKAIDAWRAARQLAGPNDLIAITGSVFLAGELRPALIAELAGAATSAQR
jgi:dihydrofolate synthase/folylpolyglutamate synthase